MKLTLLFLFVALATHATHAWLDQTPLPVPSSLRETLPSPNALKVMSLGYRPLMADYYWLRAKYHFGDARQHAALYPNLEPLLERVVALDPQFEAAYVFAGTALTLPGMDPAIATKFLATGMQQCPRSSSIAFLYGFNSYFFLHDYATATRALAQAAELPNAPSYTRALATRLAAEAGEPEIGLALVDSALASVSDPKLIQTYNERRTLLILELHLKWLRQAAQIYTQQQGKALPSIEALLETGIMRQLPDEPLGGRFYVDAQGQVQTTSEARRLRVNTAPSQLKTGPHP